MPARALVALIETSDHDHRVLGDTEQLSLIADARTGRGDVQLASRHSQLLDENRSIHGLPAFDQRHTLPDQIALKSLILNAGRIEMVAVSIHAAAHGTICLTATDTRAVTQEEKVARLYQQ